MIEDIIKSNIKNRYKKEMEKNEFKVTELLMCREKMKFIREGITPEVEESNAQRQVLISKFISRGIRNNLEGMGWITGGEYKKEFGKYWLYMYPDGIKFKLVDVKPDSGIYINFEKKYAVPEEVLIVKSPIKLPRGMPDSHLFQCMMYLAISGAKKCIVLYLHHTGFREMVVEEAMKEEQILWLITHEKSPFFKNECKTCFYREVCDKYGLKI